KESSSVAVATRKNRKRARMRRRKPEHKKMGYRMDGIFRMYIGDVEYGAIEVAKKFDTTKLLTDGFKLMKAMHDIFVCLSLKLQVLQMSSPKGYITILKREKILDVPVMAEKIKDLIRVLANVWRMKKMIMDCMEVVNMRTQDQTDFLREIMGTDTPPITIFIP
ncbi:10961_t:CDS:2, partial [Paraglomus occultum]